VYVASSREPLTLQNSVQSRNPLHQIFDLITDVTGPASSNTAILVIYDIFGYFPQTLQGADILSTADKDHSYQVFMPDFFEGQPADIAW
jgi:hypothetical protein